LKTCRERGINTAIETTGHAKFKDVEKACRYADLILYDVKQINPKEHKACTGVSNRVILENLQKLADVLPKTPIVVRTPIIPGLTDSTENIRAIASFVSGINSVKRYELLPYHRFGESKYRQLGKNYSLSNLRPPTEEEMAKLNKIAQQVRKNV
jgi:pyruvate formate lyase activating enzyme